MARTTRKDDRIVTKQLNVQNKFEIADVEVTATAAELNILDGVTATAAELNKVDGFTGAVGDLNTLDGAPMDASFVVGAEAANVINVGIQLKDGNGDDLAVIGSVLAYMSDSALGDGVAAAAASGGVAKGTDGEILVEFTADKVFMLQSEADGDIDIDITEVGVATWYLAVVLANGKLAVSGAITFA